MHAHDKGTHSGGHGGPVIYTATLVGLLILTAITVGASYVDFGPANVAIALIIASCKAILVALFFMHLKWDKPVNAIAALAGFLFLGIFLMFDLIDLSNRRDPTPRITKGMTTPTPVPESMNPMLTPAPKPYVPAPKKAEGEGGHEEGHE
jgi:cytochrome c oxidase subunit 4